MSKRIKYTDEPLGRLKVVRWAVCNNNLKKARQSLTLPSLSGTEAGDKHMPQQSIKQKVLEAVEGLPPEATIEDVMEKLFFLAKIQRGLEQADSGDTISHEEAKERLLK